jgi:hypothetical protein
MRVAAALALAFGASVVSAQNPPASKQASPPASKQANPPAQKQATPPAQKQQTTAGAQQQDSSSVADRGARSQVTLLREVFTYSDGGRRDPVVSLMSTADIRPLITELQLLSVFHDESGLRSNALLRNTTDKKTLYRVRVGQMLGRMTVTQITRTDVVFTIDEYGLNRQERLTIRPDTTGAKTP